MNMQELATRAHLQQAEELAADFIKLLKAEEFNDARLILGALESVTYLCDAAWVAADARNRNY